jgi:hypothetical protein
MISTVINHLEFRLGLHSGTAEFYLVDASGDFNILEVTNFSWSLFPFS